MLGIAKPDVQLRVEVLKDIVKKRQYVAIKAEVMCIAALGLA